ncbi:hypothetical protein K2X30_06870 [bacterium]|nr:hypothetical protein [bacterium]
MKNFSWIVLGVSFSTTFAMAAPPDVRCPQAVVNDQIDTTVLEKCMSNEGLLLEVHGAVPDNSIYVATYRDPNNFFLNLNMSLLAGSAEVKALLPTLHRHDFILVRGAFEPVKVAQKHIRATTVEVVTAWDGYKSLPPYAREVILPGDLLGKTEFIGKVHAQLSDGEILVLEYKDAVIPLFVQDNLRTFTKDLARGDKVKIHYQLQSKPKRPQHMNLDDSVKNPVEVLQSVMAMHGTQKTVEGTLVMFPKSPQVIFNVFAVKTDIGDGVGLIYTLVNFTDPALFKQLREKCQAKWDQNLSTIRNDRNKMVNDAIRVKVTGTINMVDPTQANPQVLIDQVTDLQLTP